MRDHIRIVGILNIVFGGFGILTALAFLLFFGGVGAFAAIVGSAEDPNAALAFPILGALGGILFAIIAIISLPQVAAGIGLLQYRSWGRVLGIVVSIFGLLNVPLGTAVGIYGLWVLLNERSAVLFNSGGRTL